MRAVASRKARARYEARLLAVRTVGAARKKVAVRRAVAEAHETTERNVRRWEQRYREGTLIPTPLGRPPAEVERDTRQGVIALLVALGPLCSVAAVRALFGEVPFRMIGRMKKRLARIRRKRRGRHERRLTWFEPGTSWAADFTKPKARLPGNKNRLFVVRDLASGMRLACVPCRNERSVTVLRTLTALFAAHGAPLVLKHDNGGAFLSNQTQDLLEQHGVESLPSPVYRPQYNGSCERSLGWMKVRTEHIAAREGHPGSWTQENIDRALEQANATLRPWGSKGPTPGEAFAHRKRITTEQREAFQRTVEEETKTALLTLADEHGRIITDTPLEVIHRRALTRALRGLGYLKVRRGRKSTPVPEG